MDYNEKVRLEIEVPTEGLPNLIQNPSGDLGSWGWVTPVANTDISSDAAQLTFRTSASQPAYFTTENLGVMAGRYVGARLDLKAITTGHNIKGRFEFYDASKEYISSSPQSVAFTDAGTHFVPGALAPTGTESVRLRLDLYNGTGNPSVNADVSFNRAMVTHAATNEELGTSRKNLVPNPNFAIDTLGWSAGVGTKSVARVASTSGYCLEAKADGTNATMYVPSGLIAITGGRTHTASFYHKATASDREVRMIFRYYNAAGVNLREDYSTPADPASADWTRFSHTHTAPSAAKYMSMHPRLTRTTGKLVNNETFSIDSVLLEVGTELGDYFDGNSTGAATYAFGGSKVYTNRIENPSAEINLTNWVSEGTRIRSAVHAYAGAYSVRVTVPNGGAGVFPQQDGYTKTVAVSPGKSYTASISARPHSTVRNIKMAIVWVKSNGAIVAFRETGAVSQSAGEWKRFSVSGTAPSGATGAYMAVIMTNGNGDFHYLDAAMFEEVDSSGIYFDGDSTDVANRTYAWTGTAHNSESTLTIPAYSTEVLEGSYPFVEPNDWQNIMGPAFEVKIDRQTLDVGTLSVGIRDALLDPAVADTIRPGKRIRLIADVDGVWESVFIGKVSNANVVYDKEKKVGSEVQTLITLTASDNVAHLANQGEARGLSTIEDLPFILEGKSAPWNINGKGDQVTTANIVSHNENASVLDQVAVTRDTNLGYAWVDRNGVLNVFDNAAIDTAVSATFSDADGLSYTNIDVSFNTEDCINQAEIHWLRYNIGTNSTEEIVYGPYVNQASIDQWGARSATFTIHGAVEDESDIAAYAQLVLDANATPVIRVNSLSMPVRNNEELAAAVMLDLYSLVAIKYDTKVDNTLRIQTMSHTITPSLWTVDYGFTVDGSVAAPTWVPSPPFNGLAMGTSQAGFIQMYAGSTPPNGWLICDGSTFDGNQYPNLAAVVGNSFGAISGSLYRLPDFRTRFPRGANPSVGNTGGTDTMPNHEHWPGSLYVGAPDAAPVGRATGSANTAGSSHHHGAVTGTTGIVVNNPSILPPYVTINYIIKV